MLQVGEHFDKYEEAHMDVHHQYSKNKKQIMDEPIAHSIMTQYHVSKGLKVFGKEGSEAVLN
eukprot:15117901-Ditylum_brightwellii.AAC.2